MTAPAKTRARDWHEQTIFSPAQVAWLEGFPRLAQPKLYSANVGDSKITAIVNREPMGTVWRWHLSISHPSRYPTWDEIRDARYDLLPDEITVAMLLPPRAEYVNMHPNCFHLHEIDPEAA